MTWCTRAADWTSKCFGGRARARVILLLAAALGLSGADLGAVGSMASILQGHFSITKLQIGMLVTASQGAGIFSTLFFGWLADRTRRTRVLAIAAVFWGLAMLACGAATSYPFLLMARVGLGVVAAATVPCAASLIGDYFPEHERGKVYSYILLGAMFGTIFGFILAGEMASIWWRLGFWVLLLPVWPLAWWISKLPEPERGGASRLPAEPSELQPPIKDEGPQTRPLVRLMGRRMRQAGVPPRQRLVRDEDPGPKSIGWAIKYVLSIPTNTILIICSALGYAFFADVRTFGIEYMQSWFHISHSFAIWLLVLIGLSALGGVWLGGHLADALLAKGHLPARVWVATGFFWTCAGFFLLAMLFHLLWVSVLFFMCSALSLGAINPPLDSARLDIMHPKLWGRAESVRTILRNASEAVAPATFGWLATAFGGGATGLHHGFLLMLLPLALAGMLGFVTFRTYPADTAAAEAYTHRSLGR